jgi:RimJ/RimL family protein N-acetyltransferase
MRLVTERLVLRLPRLEDAHDLVAAYSDPETMRFIGDGSTTDLAGTEAAIATWLARWDASGLGFCCLERREDGRVLGRAGFLVWDGDAWETGVLGELGSRAELEIGWTLAREHWGRGYATEAATALRDWAFGERGLTRLISLIQHGNERSVRVAEKLGERYERDVEVKGIATRLYAVER